jgi:murein DD-endopeptidase MepM/ murein hydrolase activator NlpD
VGIPLSAKTGKRRVSLRGEGTPQSLEFQVHKKKRLRQSLKVAPRQVNLSAADAARVKREKAAIDQALNRWTEEPPETLRLPQPVPGVRIGSFGLRRVFNGQSRSPHSGMDIAAPVGTQILAPAAGEVIETGDYFFTGNTVFVDHGRGLISMYCHLSKVSVKPGERISTGTSLGEVGMTGRATGPHLHWAISLNRAWIDPALFLP